MSSTALSSSTNLKKRRNSSKLSPFLPLSPSSSSYPSNLTSPSDSDSESEESFLLRELALRARRASARNSSIALVQAESGGETIGPDGEKGYWKFVSTDGEKEVGERFDWVHYAPLIVYTILSIATRLYKIGATNHVVWDEAHFGKFGSFYQNRTFFFDVHPPLGKMLVGLAGHLSSFNGAYDYPSGGIYPDHVPYYSMRVLLAIPGIAMVPLAWGTAVELGMTEWSRHIVTIMVLLDLAWLVIGRFILLDGMLLFFTFTTVYFLACFNNQQKFAFSPEWWFYLSATGASIGCVASVKWVGLFVTALVGIYTIKDLWQKLSDLEMPYTHYAYHLGARVACLILLPITIYMITFKLHFVILNQSGSGDSQMSSLFQANLQGNDFAKNPLEPAFGSKITLKNMGPGGGLLHSHVQTYPVGSYQQQVTCYHHKDANNEWLVTPPRDKIIPESEIVHLTHGAVLRLQHFSTGNPLYTNGVGAPLTNLNDEVSAYQNETSGLGENWVVEVVDDFLRGSKAKVGRIHSLSTRMRFRHEKSGCYLRAGKEHLPEWGFKQVEVSCDKIDKPKDEHTYWNIESHWNELLPAGNQKLYKSPFLRDFWHLNVAMMTSNNALIPDADKEDNLASLPLEWPLLYRSMRMNGWADDGTKYMLIGNAVVWWGSTASLVVFLVTVAWHLARYQRGFNDFAPGEWDQFVYVSMIAAGGWIFHFVPFLIMARVTYLHHYLPTLWFSVLMLGSLLDHWIFRPTKVSRATKITVFSVIVISTMVTFWMFRACAFGIEGPASKLSGLRWRKGWNIMD